MRYPFSHIAAICQFSALVLLAGCKKPTEEQEPLQTDFDVDQGGLITQVSVEIHPKVETVLVVRWTQARDTLSTSIQYTFENDAWLETPATPCRAGAHEAVLLGIPEKTDVTFYFETVEDSESSRVDGGIPDGGVPDSGLTAPKQFTATTGEIPKKMPRPTVLAFHPELADSARWMLGSVEDTPSKGSYYVGPFWIYIIDRKGRIVWYYADLGDNPCMAYPRVARDGSHLYIEKRMFYAMGSYRPRVVRMTLDYNNIETISIPGLDDCIDVTDDGGILFNEWTVSDEAYLKERRPDGTERRIWSCGAWAETVGVTDIAHYCYSNTVNWNPTDDTVLLSFPYINTAVQIDRQTGALLRQWGDAAGSYGFAPTTWSFEFNHFPNLTPDGTLLISTHAPGHEDKMAVGEHRFVEFTIDSAGQRLVEKWVYGEGVDDWPQFKGEAQRLENGNALVNYGTGGIIREVTPDKKTAWHVKWDADFSDDRFNKMVGHTILLDALYPLCNGWD